MTSTRKLLHAADLHLDSPLLGLSAYENAPAEDIRGATRRAFEAMVDLAVEEQVIAVLLAGDLFDGEWRDYSSGMFFVKGLRRLREADIPVFLLRGNHDAESYITRTLELPSNTRELSTARPESVHREDLGISVHGQGFAQRRVMENLAAAYPEATGGMLNIGMLHTALDGAYGHDPYAPCTVSDLVGLGYQYWALGHVHSHKVVEREPHIVFPGNLQGRSVRETGPKGCVIVEITDTTVSAVRPVALDVVRWTRVKVPISGCRDRYDVCDRVGAALRNVTAEAGERLVACRVELEADAATQSLAWRERDALDAEIRSLSGEFDQVWVEKVRPVTAEREVLAASLGSATGEALHAAATELMNDPARLREVLTDAGLTTGVLQVFRDGEVDLHDPGLGRRLLGEALDELLAHLHPTRTDGTDQRKAAL